MTIQKYMENEEMLKYPIGKFYEPAFYTEDNLISWIGELCAYPGLIPLSLVSKGNGFNNRYDYYPYGVSVHAEKKGQLVIEGRRPVKKGYFDSTCVSLF